MKVDKKTVVQVVLFGLVGLGSLLIDLLVTTLLYRRVGFPASISGVCGFLSAFFFNFPINRKHVFHHTDADRFSLKAQVLMFITLSLVNLVITGLAMHLLVEVMSVNVTLAKALTTGAIAVWNFVIMKMVIFSKNKSTN